MSLALAVRKAALAPGKWVSFPSALWRRAKAAPSLDLRFADNKSLTDAVTGQNLVTFTRASSGTFVGSDGLIKTATTNLLLRSEEFDNASWAKVSATISANATTAPNGTTTADKLNVDNGQSAGYAAQSLSFVSGTTLSASCYAKASEASDFRFVFESAAFGSNLNAVFNLLTGVVTSFTAGSASIQSVGSGWYRCTATATTTATASASVQFRSVHAGNGTSGIYLWGAQLEQSPTVGEYIPTTSTVNSAPRFDHNPVTGESLGLLVEESRTNLLLRSEELGDAAWTTAAATVTSNTGVAPDGSSTADTITSSGTTVISQAVTKAASAITYTGSLFVKGTITALSFSIDDGATTNRGRVVFNLSTGAISSTSNDGTFTGTSGTITSFLNGWYRLAITTTTNSTTSVRLRPFWTGSGTSIDAWGAQLETGAFPTSYIPTTTATVTRGADVASITSRGADIRSLFTQFRSPASGTRPVVSLDDNSANERIEILTSGTDPKLLVTDGGSAVADLNGGTVVANVTARAAARFNTDDYAISINGGTSQLDTSGTLPTVNRIRIGSNQAGGYLNGPIVRITGWDIALPLLTPVSG